jgi:hypothetical protein
MTGIRTIDGSEIGYSGCILKGEGEKYVYITDKAVHIPSIQL